MISSHAKGTIARLRYSLGGDRPSQTAHLTLSILPFRDKYERKAKEIVVFHCRLQLSWRLVFLASYLFSKFISFSQYQATVKLHGVLSSPINKRVSSLSPGFHRAYSRDS